MKIHWKKTFYMIYFCENIVISQPHSVKTQKSETKQFSNLSRSKIPCNLTATVPGSEKPNCSYFSQFILPKLNHETGWVCLHYQSHQRRPLNYLIIQNQFVSSSPVQLAVQCILVLTFSRFITLVFLFIYLFSALIYPSTFSCAKLT